MRLKQDDVAFWGVVGHQDIQTGYQNGTNLNHRSEHCLECDKYSNEEDRDDEIDEEGKCDPSGKIVLVPRGLDHERAQEADRA